MKMKKLAAIFTVTVAMVAPNVSVLAQTGAMDYQTTGVVFPITPMWVNASNVEVSDC